MIERERKVIVWDKPQTVTVLRKSVSVWIASGEYMGHWIEVKGSSERSALGRWRDAAQYKGN